MRLEFELNLRSMKKFIRFFFQINELVTSVDMKQTIYQTIVEGIEKLANSIQWKIK